MNSLWREERRCRPPPLPKSLGHSEACEFIVDDTLDQTRLLIAQFLELALTAPFGQSSVVLSDEHHQAFSGAVH